MLSQMASGVEDLTPKEETVDDAALALQLQQEGAQAFDKSWSDLLRRIATKRERLATHP